MGSFIPSVAGQYHFKAVSFPPIHYEGYEKTQLIHFGFVCRYVEGLDLPVGYYQTAEDILQLPLLKVTDGRIIVAETQHPFSVAVPKDDGMQYLQTGIQAVERLFALPSPEIKTRKPKSRGQ